MITTTIVAAHNAVKAGNDNILVKLVYTAEFTIVGGVSHAYWFANYTQKDGKIGYTSHNRAVQIHV